jgi:hypothetical protein
MNTQIVCEGALVIVQGHPMIASNVRWWKHADGDDVVSFTGTPTADPCNDSIRGTIYDGSAGKHCGDYQGNQLVYRPE